MGSNGFAATSGLSHKALRVTPQDRAEPPSPLGSLEHYQSAVRRLTNLTPFPLAPLLDGSSQASRTTGEEPQLGHSLPRSGTRPARMLPCPITASVPRPCHCSRLGAGQRMDQHSRDGFHLLFFRTEPAVRHRSSSACGIPGHEVKLQRTNPNALFVCPWRACEPVDAYRTAPKPPEPRNV
jgi:hypothetical protein